MKNYSYLCDRLTISTIEIRKFARRVPAFCGAEKWPPRGGQAQEKEAQRTAKGQEGEEVKTDK